MAGKKIVIVGGSAAGPKAAAKFGVRSIPTLVILKDGQEVERFVGVQPKATLLSALERHAPAK